ncbi:MAG: terminase family protein [Firmicutes bacterium]|nr:terminase family protein [Bacillota bacterium]
MQDSNLLLYLQQIEAEILRRRSANKLSGYNSGQIKHLKQIEFHKCTKRNRWVFGGNRSGKTECGAVEAIWLARGNHPYKENIKNANGWVISLSQQVQRDVAQSKILYYLNPDWIADIVMSSGRKDSPAGGVIDHILIKNVFGGISRIGFKSCDQGREKFQGTSQDFVWFDEEPPYDIYLECRMRLLDSSGQMFGTMTPLKGLTWVYNEIYINQKQDPNVWHITMEWADNPYLCKNEINELTGTLSGAELESRRYGRFTFNGGLVYSEFDENVHVIEPFDVPVEWYDNISIDPGLHNPLSAHWYAVDYDGVVYVIAEHYEAGKNIPYHAEKIKQISDRLGWPRDSRGQIRALIDSAANQRTLSGERSVAELFFEQGISVNSSVVKSLFSGISRVKSYLKSANDSTKIYIFKNCVNLINEIKGYFWGEQDAPVKKDDHALDELRYYIMSRPEPTRQVQIKSEVTKDKERLARQLKAQRATECNTHLRQTGGAK